jgi:RNA polymerase sigma-70 factor (ECF subfamily)
MRLADNVNAFVTHYSQHARAIYSYIHALVPQHSDAEDVFQETSHVLWEKFSEFRSDGDFKAWAFGIAHLKVLQSRRRPGGGKLVFSSELTDVLDQTVSGAVSTLDFRSQVLMNCLQKLAPADRELIDTRYRAGASVKEMAEASRRSMHAIYRALRRTHRQLLQCMRLAQAEEPGK